MARFPFAIPFLLLAFVVTGLDAQNVPAPQLAPNLPPLLYARLAGPKGMRVTFYRGSPKPLTFDTPCIVGVRPGFGYRMALSGIPEHPLAVYHATLEARGSLYLSGPLRNPDFPVGIAFSSEDFDQSTRNAAIKKVIVLERPDAAIPAASSADEPFEIHIPANRDPIEEALQRGSPLLFLFMGQRDWAPEEMVAPPGTLLLPGEKALPAPSLPPFLPWACYPVIDPISGQASQAELTALPDGGDVGSTAGYGRDGRVRGLDPSDTVAQYTDSRGRKKLAVSNRIVLAVPRFVVIRGEFGTDSRFALVGPGGVRVAHGFADMGSTLGLKESDQTQRLQNIGARTRLSGSQTTVGASVVGRVDGLVVVTSAAGPAQVDGTCPPPLAAEPADGPLFIIKWPDRFGALVGDIVTFTLRYTNSGARPITNVIVSDSLTTRFEYVSGSAKADRAVTFTTEPNEASSLTLRWEIPGTLLPRESGIVTFQVRVR